MMVTLQATVAPLLLLLLLSAFLSLPSTQALECGTSLTEACKHENDPRYNPNKSADLRRTNKAWFWLPGFWQGELFHYDPVTMERITQTGFIDTISGRNFFYMSPSQVFLNMTRTPTRFFRHFYMLQNGRFGNDGSRIRQPGRAVYCDSWSVATWEKDGVATNLKTVCSDNLEEYDSATLLTQSMGYPADGWGVSFVERFSVGTDSTVIQDVYTFSCTNGSCDRISMNQERFVDGIRTIFAMGDFVKIAEEAWTERISESYDTYYVTARDRILQPMQAACLNEGYCPGDKDFCALGDPSCTSTPYEEDDGELKGVVVACIVLACLAAVAALGLGAYLYFIHAQTKRYKKFFAERMLETMETTDKMLNEFTADDIVKEYKLLEENTRGEINKDNMYEFMSTGPLGYMDYWDFSALWSAMDKNKNGTVDFLEFCSIMAHSQEELHKAKLDGADMPSDRQEDDDNQ